LPLNNLFISGEIHRQYALAKRDKKGQVIVKKGKGKNPDTIEVVKPPTSGSIKMVTRLEKDALIEIVNETIPARDPEILKKALVCPRTAIPEGLPKEMFHTCEYDEEVCIKPATNQVPLCKEDTVLDI